MTFKGTLIVYDNANQKSLLIDHPHDTVYAELFVAPYGSQIVQECFLMMFVRKK